LRKQDEGPEDVGAWFCCACDADLYAADSPPAAHPDFGVPLCGECFEFYGDTPFSLDEDGAEDTCRYGRGKLWNVRIEAGMAAVVSANPSVTYCATDLLQEWIWL
jgi:hypothetical protein